MKWCCPSLDEPRFINFEFIVSGHEGMERGRVPCCFCTQDTKQSTKKGLRPHPPCKRRERQSKLGCGKPIIATEVFTLQAPSNA